MTNTNLALLNELHAFIDLVLEEKLFIDNMNHFTVQDSKLNFLRLVSLILNLPKKSVGLEIEDFFNVIGKPELACTKSAFTQQRSKLSYEFFSALNSKLLDLNFVLNKKEIKRWKKFILAAVDGSTMTLINKPDLRAFFGTQVNQYLEVPMARIMGIYDVLNQVSIACAIFPIAIAEQVIIKQWIEATPTDHLLIYDRAFPGFTTIFLHHQQERTLHYVMRSKCGLNKEVRQFAESASKDAIIYFEADNNHVQEVLKLGYKIKKGTLLKVRAIKVKLKGGEIEILLTNLFDKTEYPHKIFKDLYFKRWGIETNYNAQKNYLQIECFSGTKVNSILQDFYATVFVGNLQSILANSCEKRIEKKTRHRKYSYKINRNMAIGIMKNRIPKLFIGPCPEKILHEIIELQMKFYEPIRPGRSFPRIRKTKKVCGKYQTEMNYKRAL
jgi:hypothetical protein